MRFLRFEIEGMFAYAGKNVIDLTGCGPDENIIVVSGRNGAGKTSLLNAVKLLFLGSSHNDLRRVRVGEGPLTPKHFVLGAPGRWYGVFPYDGRSAGSEARVALFWEDKGTAFSCERIFTLKDNCSDYTEVIRVIRDGRSLKEEDAQAVMEALLPNEVVPFFFFDGEQIQSLADADVGRESTEIERLLGLSFLTDLEVQLDAFVKDRRRAGLPEQARREIVRLEGQRNDAEAEADAAERARVAFEEENTDAENRKDRLEAERRTLRAGLSDDERRRLERAIQGFETQREALAVEIARSVPLEIPFLANLDQSSDAYAALERQIQRGTSSDVATRLHADLPSRLIAILAEFEAEIRSDDIEHFEIAVREELERLGVQPTSYTDPLFASISSTLLQSLRDQFLVWHRRGAETAAAQADLLRRMRSLNAQQLQAEQELHDADIVSDEAKARYKGLSEEISGLEDAIRERLKEITLLADSESRARSRIAELNDKIQAAYDDEADRIEQNKVYTYSRRLRRALQRYRDLRRGAIRASVEKRLRDKVAILLGPSQLIKSASLSDNFAMSYQDDNGDNIARHSISAGMRQLVAMAMLWALKEEAQRPLPVMIDTPLGRIDRENRALLMSEYFPAAGNPLILLPTNSEFDELGYDQLRDRVCRRYTITNDGGRFAQIVPVGQTDQAGW